MSFSPCALRPSMIGLMVVLLTFFWMVSMVLLLWGVGAILGDGNGVQVQNYIALLQRSEMSAGSHGRGLTLSM